MITFEEAIQKFDQTLATIRLKDEEILPVREAVDRILSKNVESRLDLPSFNKSAMDGYAILENDDSETFRVVGVIPAGGVFTKKLVPGTAAKIMTGAPVPEGVGKVVMVEHTMEKDGLVRITKESTKTNIQFRAEDVKKGERVLTAGKLLSPEDCATIISCGVIEVPVRRKVKVAILVTGDEIVDRYEDIRPGKIMNSNGPLLSMLSKKSGFEIVHEARVPDDRTVLLNAMEEATSKADITILSGGVSVGDYDFVPETMNKLGMTIHFDKVAMKPGKPITFATKNDKIVIGLPGNPVSVFVTYHLFVKRAAMIISGSEASYREMKLPLERDLTRKSSSRKEFIPCTLTSRGSCDIVEYHGSGHFAALVKADGFIVLPVDIKSVQAGELVDFTVLFMDKVQ